MQERILGYDVREMWYRDQHDLVKSGRFKKMLSVEGSLWGSIFDTGDYPDLAGRRREEIGLGVVELPDMAVVGMNLPLWSRLADMQNYLASRSRKTGRLYWVVAITICLRDPERELKKRKEWPYYAETMPETTQDGWTLIGYDVTSRDSESMISPRLPPGTVPEDARELDQNLNDSMLFPSLAVAHRFRTLWDGTSPGETPHLTYGIWRVEEARY
jgi:hypothetical protein